MQHPHGQMTRQYGEKIQRDKQRSFAVLTSVLKETEVSPNNLMCKNNNYLHRRLVCAVQHNRGTVGNRAPHKHLLCLAQTQED